MTNNTINNVPRELLERVKSLCEYWFVRGQQQHMSESEHKTWHALGFGSSAFTELRALLSAPSPAGVDGLNTDRNAAFKACPESGCDWGSFYLGWKARGEVEQAIIDGLRGEVAKINSDRLACWAEFKVMTRACLDAEKERDQQAQRIGELEGLLRHAQKQVPTGSGLHMRIDAALSAVCAAAPNIATTSEHSGS